MVANYIIYSMSASSRNILAKLLTSPELPLIDAKGTVKVAPGRILQGRMIPRNNELVVQWLIQWVNLPEEAATWEDVVFVRKLFPSFNP